MKKTFFKDIFRTISKQKVSYFSIIVVAALAVTAYLGINFGAAALKNNADAFYKTHSYRDFEIDSTQLMTPDDIEKLRSTEGVKDVEPFLLTAGKIAANDRRQSVNILTRTSKLNTSEVVKGRFPESAGECALETELMETMKLKVGDKVRLVNTRDETADLLSRTDFVITGSIIHPDHYAKQDYVPGNRYVLVTEDAFDQKTLDGNVTSALVSLEKPENMGYFGNAYNKLRDKMKSVLDPLSDERSGLRSDEVRKQARDKIDEGQKELDDAWKKLRDGRSLLDEKTKELQDGEALIQSAGQLLEDGKVRLAAAEEELYAGEQQLNAAKAELDAGAATIAETEQTLSEMKTNLDKAQAELDITEAALETERVQFEAEKAGLINRYLETEQTKTAVRDGIKAALTAFAGEEFAGSFNWAVPVTEPDVENAELSLADFAVTDTITLNLYDSFADLENTLAVSLLAGSEYEGREEELKEEFANQPGYQALSANYEAIRETVTVWDTDHADFASRFQNYVERVEEFLVELAALELVRAMYNMIEEELQAGIEKYNNGLAQYEAGLNAWLSGKAQLESGKAEYQQKLSEYINGLSQIENGRTELAKGEQEYKDALAKYNDGRQKLEEAEAKLADISSCVWLVLDVKGNGGYVHALNSADNIKKLGFTFAMLFILVGALVIYVTTGRIIEESRQLVGTQKALGFYSGEILVKYLSFGGSATLIGIIIGTLLGYFGIQFAVLYVHQRFYIYDKIPFTFLPLMFLIVLALGLALTAGSVILATIKMVHRPARELMEDKTPVIKKKKKGKNVKKGRLLSRLIISNLIADKGRVAVTTISIAGCCILLMIGFTLQRGVQNAINIQFTKQMHYDAKIVYDAGTTETTQSDIDTALKDAGADYTESLTVNRGFKMGSKFFPLELTVADAEVFSKYFTLRDLKTKEAIELPQSGAVILRKLAENFDVSVGDTIQIYDDKMAPHNVKVVGICDLYFGRNVFMSNEGYKEAFGADPEPNAIYYNSDDKELETKIREITGVEDVVPLEETRGIYKNVAMSLTAVTVILIVAAGLMAYFVLLNLINMYLSQKKRELTIMRVNGFTAKEVIRYVSRESIVTTVVGILIGLAAGAALGYAILRFLEQPQAGFDLRISLLAVILSAVITAAFSIAINAFGLRKVKKLKLTDISE